MERAELSPKSKYFIEKHRYYELRHFCRQYDIWRRSAAALSYYGESPTAMEMLGKRKDVKISDPVAEVAAARESFLRRMELVDDALDKACEYAPGVRKYLFKGVTTGLSYNDMAPEVPCGKEMYYDIFRKFFWTLSHSRD